MAEYEKIEVPGSPPQDEMLNKNIGGKFRKKNTVPVQPDKKFAVVGVYLADAVVEGDIGALKVAINGITGITGSKVLVYGETPPTVGDGNELIAQVVVHLREEKAT